MMSLKRSTNCEPGTCRPTANQLYQDFEWYYAAQFSPYWLGGTHGHRNASARFRAQLLKNEKRPVMLIRCDYVRVLCDK